MTNIKQRKDGNWKAVIDFDNKYCRKGHSEVFQTRYEAKDWIKGIKEDWCREAVSERLKIMNKIKKEMGLK